MSLNQFDLSSEEYDGLFEKKVPSQLLQNPLLQKDIWLTIEDLGLEINEHDKRLSINFSEIQPLWLNLLAKLYILTRVNLKISIGSIRSDLIYIKKFACFITDKHLSSAKHIDNELFEEFDYWLDLNETGKSTKYHVYLSLKNLFNTCRIEGWLKINTYWFRARIKEPKNNNDSINYIPEEIWNQLEKHLSNFPPPMQRKVIIIRTLGLRIGELLNLPFDCLRKRGGQWRLRLKETEKFKIEDELPIPKELVLIIKEQQDYIANNLGDSYQKLFCANQTTAKNFKFRPTAKVMNTNVFGRWLNKLAKKYNICSADGKIWHFKSHQFRRTVATVMTNAGVRDLIIQKYLRHRNSEMLKYYTHQLKEVLGDEYLELIKEKNWVNIEGKVVNIHKPENAIEEYVRLKLHQITTQQGECHRSNIKNSCPTVNGCWRCKDWMTSEQDLPYLKQDLKRLKNELKKANELGMLRVEKEIQKDINFLQIRINTLEETTNND